MLHEAGCMLYWAEGTKNRNTASLTNSDLNLLRFFRRFLSECFSIPAADLVIHLHLYTGNGLSIGEIERHWLDALELPQASVRKHRVDVKPPASKGLRRAKLPYGVCHSPGQAQHLARPAHLRRNPGIRRI
jgi:hypothetical protein